MPPPTLRRESKCLPTMYQELITYHILDENCTTFRCVNETLTEDVFAKLVNFKDELEAQESYKQFETKIEKNQMIIARWNLKENKDVSRNLGCFRNSYESTSASIDQDDDISLINLRYPIKFARPVVLKIYYAIKKTLSAHCKLVLASIDNNEDEFDLANDYITKWNSYSAAIKELNSKYKIYTNLFDDIYKKLHENAPQIPAFCLLRLMAIQ